jgi:hypothetical protein
MTSISATSTGPDIGTAGWGQRLADGGAGIALLHIERARAGTTDWNQVHRLAKAMTAEPIQAHPDAVSLFQGAPAVAYALHTAGHPAYRPALERLDRCVKASVSIRLRSGHRRIDQQHLPETREYDLINGLTGLGVYLLHRYGDHQLLREVLRYLVRLSQPLHAGGQRLPGWWSSGSPDRHTAARWDGGHAGFGMAHGTAGPLALLSVAMQRGVTVDRHEDAIHTICDWTDRWRVDQNDDTWWPEVLDRNELRTGTVAHPGPHRPSWCYGTPGIARALQLAGIALGEPCRTRHAEQALLHCITDDHQLAQLTDAGLCHGWAGLVHTARRAAASATTAELAAAAAATAERMRRHLRERGRPASDGFLDGTAGIHLVDIDAFERASDLPRWDTCLLVCG